jgi:hypothetical protein
MPHSDHLARFLVSVHRQVEIKYICFDLNYDRYLCSAEPCKCMHLTQASLIGNSKRSHRTFEQEPYLSSIMFHSHSRFTSMTAYERLMVFCSYVSCSTLIPLDLRLKVKYACNRTKVNRGIRRDPYETYSARLWK